MTGVSMCWLRLRCFCWGMEGEGQVCAAFKENLVSAVSTKLLFRVNV